MNNINTTPFGAAEHCALDNWAAEYAKKLFVSEAAKRTEDVNDEKDAREAADNAEAQARATADDRLRAELNAGDTALDNKKVNRDEYATETTAGIVTLHRGSTNNSGLLIGSKGELAVNVSPDGRFGLTRDGAGQIKTVSASLDEAKTGEEAYKPMTPSIMSDYFDWKIIVERNMWKLGDTVLEDKINNTLQSRTAAHNVEHSQLLSTLTSAYQSADANLKKELKKPIQYSDVPVQTGVWVDGTPMWKVAFQITPVSEITNKNPAAENWSIDVVYDILYKLNIVKDANAVIYIDDRIRFQNNDEYVYNFFAGGLKPSTYCGYYGFNADEVDYATHFYGWVEFGTSMDNLVKMPVYEGGVIM